MWSTMCQSWRNQKQALESERGELRLNFYVCIMVIGGLLWNPLIALIFAQIGFLEFHDILFIYMWLYDVLEAYEPSLVSKL